MQGAVHFFPVIPFFFFGRWVSAAYSTQKETTALRICGKKRLRQMVRRSCVSLAWVEQERSALCRAWQLAIEANSMDLGSDAAPGVLGFDVPATISSCERALTRNGSSHRIARAAGLNLTTVPRRCR